MKAGITRGRPRKTLTDMCTCTAALLALTCTACTTTPPVPLADLSDSRTGRIEFPSGGIYQKDRLIWGYLFLPPEPKHEKVPAIIVCHGSGGLGTYRPKVYSELLGRIGVATFFIDHFTPRGVRETGTDQNRVTGSQMATDAFSALQLLSSHPRIDPRRIGIMGFSKGGTVAHQTGLTYLNPGYIAAGFRFAFHIPVYPGCNWQPADLSHTRAPMLFLLGEKDEGTPITPCLEYIDRLRAAGVPVEKIIYRNAHHAWETPLDFSPRFDITQENYGRCYFFWNRDGSWVDGKTREVLRAPDAREKARQACKSMGYTLGVEPAARERTFTDILEFVKRVTSARRE